jgi:hypothetical protein
MGIRLSLFRIHGSGTNVRDLLPHICNESLITAYPPVWGPSAFSSDKLAVEEFDNQHSAWQGSTPRTGREPSQLLSQILPYNWITHKAGSGAKTFDINGNSQIIFQRAVSRASRLHMN